DDAYSICHVGADDEPTPAFLHAVEAASELAAEQTARSQPYRRNPKEPANSTRILGIRFVGFGIWDFLVGLTLLGFGFLLSDVLHGAGMCVLQPLTAECVVDERIRSIRVLRLDVTQLQNAHAVGIRIAVEKAVDIEGHLHVGEILLEALDALEEFGTTLDAIA